MLFAMAIFILSLAFSIIAGLIASNKGRSGFGFFFLVLFLSPLAIFGLLYALLILLDETTTEVPPVITSEDEEQEPDTTRLTIKTVPEDAKVYIMGIKPKYHDGIELDPRYYLIKVTAPGYKTAQRTIEVKGPTVEWFFLVKSP